MTKALRLETKRFGKLLVIERRGSLNEKSAWLCKCDCGNTVIKELRELYYSKVSCGCTPVYLPGASTGNFTSGELGAYKSWRNMIKRCSSNIFNPHYDNYFGRGIRVCDRWKSFLNFLSDMGERPFKLTLDRIDNNGNYELSNCRWITIQEQQTNKRR